MIEKNFIGFTPEQVHQTIPARFEKIASQNPDRLAVSHNGSQLSYEQLNLDANRVANALIPHATRKPELVVLLLTEPVNHAIAQLGVMKAGMTCVPMDAAFPAARQAQIVRDSGTRIIVTESKHYRDAELLLHGGGHVLTMEQFSQFSSSRPDVSCEASSLAYVLFTSGSTGGPKGVMQTHRNLLHVAMLYHRDLGVGCDDRLTTPTSPAYTGTIWALLGSLTNGAAFVVTKFDSPWSFMESLNRERVTVAQLIVTLMRQFLLAFDEPLEIPSLRLVYTGGEALHRVDVKEFARLFPAECNLLYNFGSTEAGMVTHFPVDRQDLKQCMDAPALPVGFPVEDTVVKVLDEKGDEFLNQEEGEIVVSSHFLSPGYWRDEELTARRFKEGGKYGRIYFTGDFGRITRDGHLIHVGRKDNQVKVRGYTINLEEIEETLRSMKGIAAAAVLVHNDRQGKSRIVAYLEWNGSTEWTIAELRNHLEALLPVYMIPSLIFYIDRLPVAPNGKLNRNLLAGFNCSRPELNTPLTFPKTDTERLLCVVLSEILSVEPVGAKDNLFELGADSISIFQLIGRIQSILHIDINPAFVFSAPVIADLARKLEGMVRDNVR